ncbi:MAG: hypothetical protein ACK4NH_11845, partial [Gemmobacter sp.]
MPAAYIGGKQRQHKTAGQGLHPGLRLNNVMRMETPDEQLALAAAGGDRAAFAALVTRHYARI